MGSLPTNPPPTEGNGATGGRRKVAPRSHRRIVLEAAAVLLAGAGGMAVSARYNFYEHFLKMTRGLERYNVDEAPFALFVLTLTLGVFAYRRWREYAREVEHRERLEAAAAKAHERLVDAVESMPAGVMLFGVDDRLVLANSKFAEFFPELASMIKPGVTFADLVRASVAAGAIADAEGKEEMFLAERIAAHKEAGCVFEERRSDGRWLQIQEHRTADGGTVGVYTDISDLKRQEAGLREARKMEAVGRLTGGIAHDFNNLLTIVLGNLQMLEDLNQAGAGADLVQEALAASKRGGQLTERLLAFARRKPLRSGVVDAAELVSGMAGLLARALGDPIEVRTRIAPGLWPAKADRSQLENAVLNLALNARDAMPSGGTLTIECDNVRAGAGVPGLGDLAPGDYIRVSVADTGTGMAMEIAERAFDPFFTTKPEGKGTGLGLSMVYGFARQLGGAATIASRIGEGTVVTLFLPRASEEPGGAGDMQPKVYTVPDEEAFRGKTVLVVEDDPGVRRIAVRALRNRGLDVFEAGDGPEALEILEGADTIDLLFTDMAMPGGMTGLDLAEVARQERPNLPVLIASGNPEDRLTGEELAGSISFLHKPYDGAALARRVGQILEDESEPEAAPGIAAR